MNARQAYLLGAESQLLVLDHEILVLKFRVEEAEPGLMTNYYKYVINLRDRYNALEAQLQAFRETEQDNWMDLQTVIDSALYDLRCLTASICTWVRLQLPSSYYVRS
jgi:hypothetical protein